MADQEANNVPPAQHEQQGAGSAAHPAEQNVPQGAVGANHQAAPRPPRGGLDRYLVCASNGAPMFRRGVLDTRENVHAWLGSRLVFGKLIFKAVNIEPFAGAFDAEEVIMYGHILCYGKMLSEGGATGFTPGSLRDRRLLLIGEIMTPVKQTGMDLPMDEARAAYIGAVSALRTDTNITYMCEATRERYIASGATEAEWTEHPLSMATARKMMDYFVSTHFTQLPLSPVAMLTYAFVAMAKRGTISDDFRTQSYRRHQTRRRSRYYNVIGGD
ncbi:hypothetical protein Y032_0015g2520 [Ancylostoma ceylanicum]|nr:hypothetical protein Y032_0015g2520 [Ancylostoma ceylanicum]